MTATPSMVRDALAALAYQAPDVAKVHVEHIAVALLAHLPGATLAQWTAYTEAYEQWFHVSHGGDIPDRFDEVAPAPCCRRDVAIQITETERDDALDVLMAYHPGVMVARMLAAGGA